MDKKSVCNLLRSILIPHKQGVPIDRIHKEFLGLVGKPIPCRALGYTNLEEFLDQSPDTCRVSYRGDGTVMIHCVATEETAHIQDMVKAQKNKKVRVPQRRPNRGGGMGNGQRFSGGNRGMQNGGPRRPQMMGQSRPMGSRPMGTGQQQGRGGPGMRNRNTPGSGRFPNMPNNGRSNNSGPRPASLMANPFTLRVNPSANSANINNNNNSKRSNNNNNNVTTPKPAPMKVIPASELMHKKELLELCKARGYEDPEFKTSSMSTGAKGSAAGKTFCGAVLVAGERLQTFPKDYPTSEMAEDAVSKKALDKLRGDDKTASPTPGPGGDTPAVQPLPAPILTSIVAILGKRKNGVWSTQVDVEYKRAHGSTLPDNWPLRLAASDKCPLRMDSPIEGKYIILPNVSYTEENKSSSPSQNGSPVPSSTSSTSATNGHIELPRITFPEEEFWYVYITTVTSPVNCYIRLLGNEYSNKFDELVTEMELHYFKAEDKPAVEKPKVGSLYVAMYEGEWHRVRLIELSADGTSAKCFLIDNGETDSVPVGCIQELHESFRKMPAQAFSVKLFGLEAVTEGANVQSQLQNTLLGKSLVGQPHWNNGSGPESDPLDLSLTLFDSSTEVDINLNEQLLTKLQPGTKVASNGTSSPAGPRTATPTSPAKPAAAPVEVATAEKTEDSAQPQQQLESLLPDDLASLKELMPPKVPGKEAYFDVTVTSSASPLNFTVQPWESAPELDDLQMAINQFYNSGAGSSSRTVCADDLETDKFFAARHTDGIWYRVRVKSYVNMGQVSVRLVDFGDYTLAAMSDMRPLASQFRNMPMQAINAKLADIIPVDGDWSLEDIHWFSQRVLNKQFVSIVKDRFYDAEDGVMQIIISLIDVSHPTRDVIIENELETKGRAVFLCL